MRPEGRVAAAILAVKGSGPAHAPKSRHAQEVSSDMASRKELKEQARAQRLAQQQARAARDRRGRRLQMLGGIIVAAVVLVVVAVAVSSGGSSAASGLQNASQSSKTVVQVQGLLSGIPQSGATLGNPHASVKMTYFGDLECPICQEFTLGISGGGLPQFVSKDVRQGKVQVVYSAFESATRNPQTFQTQEVAALAAGMQDKFWQYAELFYHQQGQEDTGYVTESYLDGLAHQIPGLDYNKWLTDRKDPTLLSEVQSQEAAGTAAGVQGTPTVVFQGPKGKASPSSGIPTYSDLQQSLRQVS